MGGLVLCRVIWTSFSSRRDATAYVPPYLCCVLLHSHQFFSSRLDWSYHQIRVLQRMRSDCRCLHLIIPYIDCMNEISGSPNCNTCAPPTTPTTTVPLRPFPKDR
ncbi:hypothetical protein BDN72DRAFT_300614 [Pluteus cervinus]|uniref:Uncharacterized protein n=1 Tax=Pluteus cervinus TaxID=181527 RepID=A0ACD3ADH9_9AGAR|nr:hypothetical protein BDN72DRAFT_300614 [Pluteus cervinus]